MFLKMLQIVLFCQKITYFRNSGTKLQLFFHICKRTRDFLSFWQKKRLGMHFVLAYMEYFSYLCSRILCVTQNRKSVNRI